ncbi:UDP-2,3-diacylglucosamine diphosphatase [Moraxella nasovis]|uniref:UDP-2,3-diacylglucosamine diphosphatase n=1 Tax=Moraxella nasovis TaxID=2904121 RepID=UPI001F617B84|nr:UDP-2,3-diacylglucosamine diphosphatase [Moraxella nasovis]UNU72985.1 UDP-2,3-diacylglucosamine diphosphatase [Moraxella nasovis]
MPNSSQVFLSFEHLLTTKPHDIRAVFVSDLHLSEQTTSLTAAFNHLLMNLIKLPNLQHLFILGDFLDAWLGDDDFINQTWLKQTTDLLQALSDHCHIYIMHGNRDFTLGQQFCDIFRGTLIQAPYYHAIKGKIIRLEHGDALCTDDISYQRYRAIIQNPVVKFCLLNTPLVVRQKLAKTIKSQAHKDKNKKPKVVMDVNDAAVQLALKTCDILIHGHTHRPAVHNHHDKTRVVLGDWHYNDNQVTAVIGVACETVALYTFKHQT